MLILFIQCFFGIVYSDHIVDTSCGPIRGVSSLEQDVDAYLGIPYAEPPVDELRFYKPIPKTRWTEVYNASILPPPCPQMDTGPYYFMPDVTKISEDCLYLNIWAPKSNSNEDLKPIILFIHPGGFIMGSSNLKAHDGSHLASRGNLVVVTINYRLGALGYLLAFSEEADGNMGMYDQIMAIKWVKENAKQFGGDPENIVLMGASAGAYSISSHMVSPLSQNLFKRAIIESGTLVNPMLSDDNAVLFQNSRALARLIGCENETSTLKDDPRTVVKCLKNKSKEDIIAAEKTLFATTPALFFPRVNDEFLPKGQVELYREGKFRKDVEVLAGVNEDEGTLLTTVVLQDSFGVFGEKEIVMNKHRALVLSTVTLTGFGQSSPGGIIKKYINRVKDRTALGYSKVITDIMGDFLISCNTVFLADFLSVKGNPVYFYKFGFRSPSTPMANWIGATHLDEVQYVFGNSYHGNFTAEENELSNNLIDRWSTFARTGNPNILGHMPWLRYSYSSPLYLSFGQTEESIRMTPNDRCEIWRKRYNVELDAELIQSLRNSGAG